MSMIIYTHRYVMQFNGKSFEHSSIIDMINYIVFNCGIAGYVLVTWHKSGKLTYLAFSSDCVMNESYHCLILSDICGVYKAESSGEKLLELLTNDEIEGINRVFSEFKTTQRSSIILDELCYVQLSHTRKFY